jgi:hypothetical protein
MTFDKVILQGLANGVSDLIKGKYEFARLRHSYKSEFFSVIDIIHSSGLQLWTLSARIE